MVKKRRTIEIESTIPTILKQDLELDDQEVENLIRMGFKITTKPNQ